MVTESLTALVPTWYSFMSASSIVSSAIFADTITLSPMSAPLDTAFPSRLTISVTFFSIRIRRRGLLRRLRLRLRLRR